MYAETSRGSIVLTQKPSNSMLENVSVYLKGGGFISESSSFSVFLDG